MISFAKIPIRSSGTLAAEITQYATTWQPHFNTLHYRGEWTVLPLRAPGGADSPIPDLMDRQVYIDTIHMQHFSAVKELVNSLKCPVQSVRFLNLKAGSEIKPHRDYELAFENGEARLHFPVITNPRVEFYVENTRIDMRPGECWYINANLVHRVSNKGTTDRIHLVIDCQVNNWLSGLFDQADKHIKDEKIDIGKQKQIIAALRSQNTPSATQLANQMEKELLN